jgi:hypothetical protein
MAAQGTTLMSRFLDRVILLMCGIALGVWYQDGEIMPNAVAGGMMAYVAVRLIWEGE